MSKQNKSKSKKSVEKKEKRNKIILPVIIIAGIAVVGFFGTFGIMKLVNYYKAKTIQVAYYQLPDDIIHSLSENISKENDTELKFTVLSDNDLELKSLKKKYDILFTWDGELVDSLSGVTETIQKKCYSLQPSSYNQPEGSKVYVQLSNYEMAYHKKKTALFMEEYPSTMAEFEEFLKKIQKYVFCPFICEGNDDKVLLAFIGSLIEGETGSDGYTSFIEEMRSGKSFEELLDVKIYSDKDHFITLHQILDELKTWPSKGYTHPSWFLAKSSDIETFMESDQVGAVFTSLEKHRQMRYRDIEKFESCRFPVSDSRAKHGTVMPAVTCVKLSSTADIDQIVLKLLSQDMQEQLSFETMYAPTTLRGQAYDRQADDVRFWAASCKSGPMPDLFNAVYQTKPEAGAKFASEIRGFLRQK